jgi:type IV pilus assembly protein PilW
LIELMVAMTIGLIITIAVFSSYLGALGASKVTEAQSRMNEDAQATLTILTQQLRMAGYKPDKDYPSSYFIRGCDGTFSNIKEAANLEKLTCDAAKTIAPDSIAISYVADKYNTIQSLGLPTDCLGSKLLTPFAMADIRFYIASTSSVPSLYCKGNGVDSKAQALVENIEDLQFVYGMVKPPPPPTTEAEVSIAPVAGYIRADQFLDAGLKDDAASWGKNITVRICILVRSDKPVLSSDTSAQYVKCDGTLDTAPPDFRLRRAYHTTVVLRNRRS